MVESLFFALPLFLSLASILSLALRQIYACVNIVGI